MIHKNRGNRRWKNHQKAKRKWILCQSIYGNSKEYHKEQIHRYDKGKIHCSCPMCSAKTNDSINKSRGPLNNPRRSSRLAGTHHRYGRKNWKRSDQRKIDNMNNQILTYAKENTQYENTFS